MAGFHGRLAAEAYARADLITPGNTHTRRWQERCGAERERLRTVYPGMDATRFAEVGEQGAAPSGGDDRTLVWVGRIEPSKDVIALLHAFAEVRRWQPDARLRIIETRRGEDPGTDGYPAHCRALAEHLFPDEAADAHSAGDNPVSFERLGDPEVPTLADAYGAGGIVVLSSVVEGFPVGLVEAMVLRTGRAVHGCGRGVRGHRRHRPRGAPAQSPGARGRVPGDAGRPRAPCAPGCRGARPCAGALHRRAERRGLPRRSCGLMLHCPVRREEVGEGGGPLRVRPPRRGPCPGRWTAGRGGAGSATGCRAGSVRPWHG
ncbi:Transferase OS=Streptomyces antimycoticus OX=68175 GN=SANT12839_061990 PE=4 SV=1 [Streptomyces antimycoticus]